MPHTDSGWRCLVYHGPNKEPCIRCAGCSQYIRPENMNEECPNDRSCETVEETMKQIKAKDYGPSSKKCPACGKITPVDIENCKHCGIPTRIQYPKPPA